MMLSKKIDLFIDTDPGVDDAVALILALLNKDVEIRGISTVFGNHSVEQTTQNAARIISYINSIKPSGIDVPLIKGSAKPLKGSYNPFNEIHGKDGLGEINLPHVKYRLEKVSAENFINKIVRKYPDRISLLCLGPLTNIAKFILKYPRSVGQLKELVVMGGVFSYPGNFSPLVEANFGRDPEAARIVTRAKFRKITLVPLNVTENFQLTQSKINKLKNKALRETIGKIMENYSSYYRLKKKYILLPGTYHKKIYKAGVIHDVVALLSLLLARKEIETSLVSGEVVTEGPDKGQSFVYNRGEYPESAEQNLYLVKKVSEKVFWKKFFQILNYYG